MDVEAQQVAPCFVEKLQVPFKVLPLSAVLVVGGLFFLSSPPLGVSLEAFHLLGIFVATILAIVLQALPIGLVALVDLVLLPLTHTLTFEETLSGMSMPVVWLVVMAFFVARAVVKTGLGKRIAYHLIKLFGKKSLGLSYGLVFADAVLAMAIPSNTARAGGILFPILKSLAQNFESIPEKGSERKIGSYLLFTVFQANSVTSGLFITAMASNSMIVTMLNEVGVKVSWLQWFYYSLVPSLVALLAIPLVLYFLYPPEIKETPKASLWAREKLSEMGAMTRGEYIMSFVFLLLISLWIFGGIVGGIENGVVAILGVVILLLSGVLEWQDILEDRDAWGTFLWFSTLLMMACFLAKLGMIKWMGTIVQGSMSSLSWPYAYLLLSLIFFYIHYFFAGNTPHVSSLYAVFLAVGLSVKIPLMLIGLTLAYMTSLFGCLTHYATGPAPVFFGAGYVSLKDWWRLGFVVSLIHLVCFMVIGPLWWKFLGLW